MPKSPTKRRPRTVAALLDGALHAFAERGFDGASIGYICERAGLTTGAFYSNFASKQELFFALLEARAAGVLARFEELTGQVESRPELLDQLLGEALEPTEDAAQWSLVTLEFRLFAMRHPDAADELLAHELRLRSHIAGLLGRALRAAGRRSAIDLDELARLVIAVYAGLALRHGSRPEPGEPEELAARIMPTLLHALSSAPPASPQP
ncbi:MAG TPA: TetR/AcrR family transcriptional regulator [Pseudonocardiaceae bacterium]|jgi:AcrR family transcriptional regulator|nr:TetR/AcrR family transcriptional regulator [Pseudonocardiaceae bacterium]